MKIHEYQAKELFAAAGANTPASSSHLEKAAPRWQALGGTGAMIKAQIRRRRGAGSQGLRTSQAG